MKEQSVNDALKYLAFLKEELTKTNLNPEAIKFLTGHPSMVHPDIIRKVEERMKESKRAAVQEHKRGMFGYVRLAPQEGDVRYLKEAEGFNEAITLCQQAIDKAVEEAANEDNLRLAMQSKNCNGLDCRDCGVREICNATIKVFSAHIKRAFGKECSRNVRTT